MCDVVYIVLQNGIDWSAPPPTFAGVGRSVREALDVAIKNKDDVYRAKLVEDWIQEKDLEIRAYYTVNAYDMTTSPPTLMDRPDLNRGGGPVRHA